VNSIRLLLAASAGMAIPCLAYAALYARIGALDALFYNTLRLPQRMTWFVPFRAPGWPHAWLYSTIACSVVVLCEWQARRRRGVLALGAAALTVSAAAALLAARAAPGLGAYLLRAGWTNEMLPLLPVFPILVLGWAVITSLGDPARRSGAEPAEAHRHRLALLFFFGFTAILLLYPAADIPHGAMLMPAFLPLAAYGLSWRGRPVGGATLALVALWLAGAAWPFLGPRLTAPPEPAGGLPTFARASGIVRADQRMIDVSRLVRRLSEAGAHDRGLLVIVDEPMLYFLADAVSALPREEFVLFLVGSGLVEDGVARSLVDESASIDRLAGSRPLVVDYPDSIEEGRFRRVFPRIAAFIDARYRPAAAVGGYRILAPDGAPSRSR
jgi:hypothetical protein